MKTTTNSFPMTLAQTLTDGTLTTTAPSIEFCGVFLKNAIENMGPLTTAQTTALPGNLTNAYRLGTSFQQKNGIATGRTMVKVQLEKLMGCDLSEV